MIRTMILSGVICNVIMFTACEPEPAKEFHSGTKQNMKTEALRTLRETDRRWCQSASTLEGFMSFLADDIVWYFCDRSPLKGKEEVRSFLKKVYEDPAYSLTWTPEQIDVSDSGDMMKGTPEELKAAFEGFDAYCGTYDINDAYSSVTHHL